MAINNNQTSTHLIYVAILYCAFLNLSNLIAGKVITVLGLHVTAAVVFFPLTYIFADILTEVYGFKASRRVIWMGLISNTIVTFGAMIAVYLPAAPFWHQQQAYHTVFATSLRVFFASSISYVAGEFVNAIMLAKLKVLTSGKHLWLRALSSTAIGVGVDTVIFISLAFYGAIPTDAIIQMIYVVYLSKVVYEVLALPITYKVARYLKSIDGVDVYDSETVFNPFSLKM